ncbi:transposase [Arthrobacter nanjingensis]|uniref:transposase n=1 Tax=Arthrobacter TaxID=1663 RepID=UPI003CC6F58C
MEGELTDHLGYDKRQKGASADANTCNGSRSTTVLMEAGPVSIAVPRDRAGTFEPRIVAKRLRRLGSIVDIVLSLSARV